MEFPIRCFTCGSVIGDLYEEYKKFASSDANKALDQLGITRYCCRSIFISHINNK